MELPVNRLGKRFADSFHLAELFDTGLRHFTQPAEMRQQAAPPFIPYPADFLQAGCGARLAALGAVAGDGETMRLIADLLDQVQRRVIAAQLPCRAVGENQLLQPGLAFLSLGHADQCRSEERRVGKECRSRWSPYH